MRDTAPRAISRATELRQQADSVLAKSGICEVLSEMGSVEFVGSYALDLLVRPDIDIIVTSDLPERAAAVKATKHILDQGYFQSVVFIDHSTFRKRLDAGMDAKGFYWHLDVPEFDFDQQWKVDVWYLEAQQNWFHDRTNSFRDLLAANPAARERILELKAHFLRGNGYAHGLKGGIICEAVLEHGLRTPEEIVSFAKMREPPNKPDAGNPDVHRDA